MQLDLDAVAIEPFAPQALGHDDLERFFLALAEHDDAVAARIERIARPAASSRYLAQIDPSAPRRRPAVRVGPVEVEPDHPAARLRGTEAFVAFTTDRHRAYPLLVQGRGAGGAVTAAGVLTDILKIAMSLRGRLMANLGYIQVVRHCNHFCGFCSRPRHALRPHPPESAQALVDDLVARDYFGRHPHRRRAEHPAPRAARGSAAYASGGAASTSG